MLNKDVFYEEWVHTRSCYTMNILNNILKNYRKELVAVIMFLVAFIPALAWMWDRWFVADSYYSHGVLIPFVSGYFVWQLKDQLKEMKRESSALGMWLICFGLGIHLVSSLLRVYFTSGFAMLIVLAGMILHFYGYRIFIKVLFPFSFLIFMVPLPMVVITNLSFKLKLFAAQIATFVLNDFIGVAAIREGSMIQMKHSVVVVDDVCSGLRSLISLTALGAIFAYWLKENFVKKLIVFASTIPIAVATNVVRILFLAIVSEVWGTKYIVGPIHDISGFMVFAVAFLMLLGVSKLLES